MSYCQECGADLGTANPSSCPECGATIAPTDERSDGGYRTDEGESDPWGGTASEPPTADPKPDDGLHGKGVFDFSLKYPIAGGYKPLAIGSLLMLTAVFIVPLIALYGYGIRLGRAAMRGDPEPPQYDDWGGLLGDGLRLIAVSIPFLIVAAVAVGIPVALEMGWLAALLYLAVVYVGGAIYPTFLATGSVTKTYKDLRFLKLAVTVDYLKAIAILLVLQFGLMMVVGIMAVLLSITIVGLLLVIPLYLVAFVYLFYLVDSVWGHVYYTAAKKGTVPPVENTDTLGTRL